MSRGRSTEPREILREIRARQPAESQEEVEVQLNLIEELVASISPHDDYQEVILEAVRELTNLMGAGEGEAAAAGIPRVVGLLEQQVEGNIDSTDLPIGMVGEAVESVPNGSFGTALFDTWAGRVAAEIEADGDVVVGDTIVIVGRSNLARVEEAVADALEDPEGVTLTPPEQVIHIGNETWENTDDRLNPNITAVSPSGDLEPGDEEVMVQARVGPRSQTFDLSWLAVGVTKHVEDIDSDGREESAVRYHYEYQDEVNGAWKELTGPSGTHPIGSIDSPEPLVTEGNAVGPIKGFRIRFENWTDDPNVTQYTVPQDTLGARTTGRVM